MNGERPVYVSEDEAARVWTRAAELQVRESQKVEARSKDLHTPPGPSGFPAGQHLALDEVIQAAREVGIDDLHLEVAVTELLEERAQGGPPEPDLIERWAARFFGSPPPALEATAVIDATPSAVYRLLQRLLPAEPYWLRLRGVLGDDPITDGVLVFDAPDRGTRRTAYTRRTLMAGDRVHRLYVTLRPHGDGARPGCRVTLRGRIQADPEPAFWMGSVATAGGAGVGGVVGGVIAGGLGVGGALFALPAGGVALLAGWGTYLSVRSRYLAPLRRGLRGLEELLEVLAATVKTDGGFLPADGGTTADGRPRRINP